MNSDLSSLEEFLLDKRLTYVNDLYIATDEVDYVGVDQVLPIYAEQPFFFAELNSPKIQGANVLEIGLGSGILSIGCIKAGAKRVTALEINDRAKELARVNISLNLVDQEKIEIVDGDDDLFKPVTGAEFDYIISNPPFEPTPPESNNYLHSAAGIYGLDFLVKIFSEVDAYLSDTGHCQIVTGVPGNDQEPSMLLELVEKYLHGQTKVVVNPVPIAYDTVLDFHVLRGLATQEQVNQLKQVAQEDGITQYYLCIIHYEKGPKSVALATSDQAYHQWGLPIDASPLPKKSLVQLLSKPRVETPAGESLVTLFEQQVRRNPNQLAIVSEEQQLTYAELNQRAEAVAAQLQALAIQPAQFVGLHCNLSTEAIVGLWGILKAGGAFVPLDPAFPPERLQHILNVTSIAVILTNREQAKGLPAHQASLLYLDELFRRDPTHPYAAQQVSPTSLACSLYTSGSTGQPKGALLEHQALAKHFASLQYHYQLTAADRILQFASLTHIAGVEQVIMTLLSGATLVVPEQKLWTVNEFLPKVDQYGLTMVDLPASYYQVLAQEWAKSKTVLRNTSLRILIVGGELTTKQSAELWSVIADSDIRYINVYGMTEVGGTATLFEMVSDFDEEWASLPIGAALPNRTAYIVNDLLQPVPYGEPGELCIGGTGLGRGYLNQPALTAEKFVKNPFGPGLIYRTGDLARQLPDGNLEYLGRKDHQVQLRGFRIELGEIETALEQHPSVERAAVVVQGVDVAKRLVAYVAAKNGIGADPLQFWQPDRQYREEADVIADPVARMNFKLAQHNLREADGEQIRLQKPLIDDALQRIYLLRQSYRQFADRPITFAQFSLFLSTLLQIQLPSVPIPKYRYPSALGLYPVQTYLYVKQNQVEGVSAGFYYYHPVEHDLRLLHAGGEIPPDNYTVSEQSILSQADFALFLVAHIEAISPLYGQSLAKEFCQLEAGYIGQLLMTEAPNYQMGLCPIATMHNFAQIKAQLGLTETQTLVHSFLGGAIDPVQTKGWLQPTPAQLQTELLAYLRHSLPAQMIPDRIILQESLPMTPNGKIDRIQLATAQIEGIGTFSPELPKSSTEQQIAAIWKAVLQIKTVDSHDNFFEVGGNSLSLIQVHHKLVEYFGADAFTITTLLQYPTIYTLAQYLNRPQDANDIDEQPLTHKAKRGAFLQQQRAARKIDRKL